MPTQSAGLLPHLSVNGVLHVWLAHMGGPFWARKDEASWTIVKGEHAADEDPRVAAIREWNEEMGSAAPSGEYLLGAFRQSSRKTVTVYGVEVPQRESVRFVQSNTVELEWPPRSGRLQLFPEIDRAEWFDLPTARVKILRGQLPVLGALEDRMQSTTR